MGDFNASGVLQTILTMSGAGSVLALLYFAVKPIVKHRLLKSVQYYLWLVVLAALIIPFSMFVKLPESVSDAPIPIAVIHETVRTYVNAPPAARGNADSDSVQTSVSTETPAPAVTLKIDVIGIIFVIYPIGVIVYLFINMFGYFRFTAKLKRRNIATGIKCKLTVCKNPLALTPMLVGLFRPVIILPDREYSAAHLEYILHHELTHYRRRDVAVKWLSVLAGAIHWFNPLVYLARRELDRICELSCDETVIRSLDASGKREYGNTLIEVAADNRIPSAVLSTTMCEEKSALKERLGAIMKNKKYTRRTIIFSIILVILVSTTAVLIGAAVNNSQDEQLPSIDVASGTESGTEWIPYYILDPNLDVRENFLILGYFEEYTDLKDSDFIEMFEANNFTIDPNVTWDKDANQVTLLPNFIAKEFFETRILDVIDSIPETENRVRDQMRSFYILAADDNKGTWGYPNNSVTKLVVGAVEEETHVYPAPPATLTEWSWNLDTIYENGFGWFIGTTNIKAGPSETYIYLTYNDGETWEEIGNLNDVYAWSPSFGNFDENVGLVGFQPGFNGDHLGKVFMTTDKGKTWTELAMPKIEAFIGEGTGEVQRLSISPDGTGSGRLIYDNNAKDDSGNMIIAELGGNVIIATVDGGATWFVTDNMLQPIE
ncbi:hypothetical protein FACS1894105_04930 [Clostridia bacterium]|nr:hypothetical protein FACS1894105_04930 [Clostridia bacterium]